MRTAGRQRQPGSCGVASALGRAGLALALVLLMAPEAQAAKKKQPRYEPAELTNFTLSPELSRWLVGAVSWLATEDEVHGFLALRSDAEAEAFIEQFWKKRAGASDSPWPTNRPRAIFTERAREADRMYTEGLRRGRTTDRGTIYILYGEPEEVTYQTPENRNRPPVEVWSYPKDAEPGLDGNPPKRKYFFSKTGEVTEFSSPVPPPRRRPI